MGGMSFGPRAILDGQVVIAYVHDVVILVFHVKNWTPEFVDRLYAESTALTSANPNTLCRVEGAEPGAAVRRRMADLQAALNKQIPNETRRVAILTDSVMVRGAITAMRWITGDQISGFATSDIYAAAAWAGGPTGHTQRVMNTYHECAEFFEKRKTAPPPIR